MRGLAPFSVPRERKQGRSCPGEGRIAKHDWRKAKIYGLNRRAAPQRLRDRPGNLGQHRDHPGPSSPSERSPTPTSWSIEDGCRSEKRAKATSSTTKPSS